MPDLTSPPPAGSRARSSSSTCRSSSRRRLGERAGARDGGGLPVGRRRRCSSTPAAPGLLALRGGARDGIDRLGDAAAAGEAGREAEHEEGERVRLMAGSVAAAPQAVLPFGVPSSRRRPRLPAESTATFCPHPLIVVSVAVETFSPFIALVVVVASGARARPGRSRLDRQLVEPLEAIRRRIPGCETPFSSIALLRSIVVRYCVERILRRCPAPTFVADPVAQHVEGLNRVLAPLPEQLAEVGPERGRPACCRSIRIHVFPGGSDEPRKGRCR